MFVPLQGGRPADHRSARTASPNTGDEVPPQPGVHGADPRPEPARARTAMPRHDADDVQDADNTDSPVGRPEPDLHLARLAPGVPARVRARTRPDTGRVSDRQAARRPAAPAGPTPARRTAPTRHRRPGRRSRSRPPTQLGLRLVDTDVTQHPDARHRPVRQVHPRPARAAAVRAPTDAAWSRATSTTPGRRCPANVVHFDTPFLTDIAHNADPSRRTPTTTGVAGHVPTPDADNTASADFAQPAGRHLRRRDARRALHLR